MKILIALILGAIVGYFLKLGEKGKNINGKLQQLGVIFLLFSMGASIGADKDIIKNLPSIGLKSFLFAVATIGISIVLVYILSEKFMPKTNQLSKEEVIVENGSERLNEACGEDK